MVGETACACSILAETARGLSTLGSALEMAAFGDGLPPRRMALMATDLQRSNSDWHLVESRLILSFSSL